MFSARFFGSRFYEARYWDATGADETNITGYWENTAVVPAKLRATAVHMRTRAASVPAKMRAQRSE